MKRWKLWAGVLCVLIAAGALMSTMIPEEGAETVAVNAEVNSKADAKKAGKKTAEDTKKTADEEAKAHAIEKTIADFTIAKEVLISESNGVITKATIKNNGIYRVDVYVDETIWASSSDSEKESFATTVGNAVQQMLPDSSLVDFRSATNNDLIAEGKVTGGYKINR